MKDTSQMLKAQTPISQELPINSTLGNDYI